MGSLSFLISALAAVPAAAAVRALCLRFGWISRPNSITSDARPQIALMGGVAVAGGAAAGLAAGGGGLLDWRIAGGGLVFLAFGVLDDFRPFRPLHKFAGQAVAAAVAALCSGPTGLPLPAGADLAVQVLAALALVNAFNFTDVSDGLTSGLSCIGLAGLALAHPELSPVTLSLAGGFLGFLALNRPPARIFLGDGGAHMAGFVMSQAGLRLLAKSPSPSSLASLILFSSVPLFETVFITSVRISKGLPWWRGSPDHFALRLQAKGWTRWQVNFAAWGGAAVFAGLGLAVSRSGIGEALASLGLAVLASAAAAWALLKDERERVSGSGRS